MQREFVHRLLFQTPFEELCDRAARVLEEEKGVHVYVRGLVEFSNQCRRNCKYCGLRSENGTVRRYALGRDEILRVASQAVSFGADTVVLQSGEYGLDVLWLADVIETIRKDLNVPVTLCVGEHSADAYALWKEAGAVRFLLKHETADPELYASLHPGHTLEERVSALRVLQHLGFEAGTGFMVGLPGQRPESLVDDILLARRLRVAMCGVGPFVPQASTPLGQSQAGSAELTLRVMAVLRIMLPWANIPATTALATVDAAAGQRNGLLAGGNVLMPSFTPEGHREEYRIYDHKNRVDIFGARDAIESAGRSHGLNLPDESPTA